MLELCVLIILVELVVIAVLLFLAIRNVKKQGESHSIDMVAIFAALNELNQNIGLKMDAINASIDQSTRHINDFKQDIDVKFGPDLVKQLNAIFKLKTNPGNLVLGADGEFHKSNRDY
jgi:competence protein ComGC